MKNLEEKLNQLFDEDLGKIRLFVKNQIIAINELSQELEGQKELNRNLIRISKQRKNKENNLPQDHSGFQLLKINTYTFRMGNFNLDCYKLKIKTPYDANAYNYPALLTLEEQTITELNNLIGAIEYVADPTKLDYLISVNPTINYVWRLNYEIDVEHNSINMYLLCFQPPIFYK